ncbi:MAG: DUF815 domain-containing protein, partial [Selenomonadaceae bacterium]|nr:DUF815 domain-containing protein [Selenomonadaceae bacterium]
MHAAENFSRASSVGERLKIFSRASSVGGRLENFFASFGLGGRLENFLNNRKDFKMNLQGLIVCRNLLDTEIFDGAADKFETASHLVERAELLGLSGNLYRAYLIYLLAHEPNLISTSIEMRGGKIGESLREIFVHDVEILLPILRGELWSDLKLLNLYKPTAATADESFNELLRRLENLIGAEEIADAFIEHWRRFGYGDIATYRAFRWDAAEKNIVGIRHFETIRLDDLIGYAHQKELLTGNTTAFVSGKPANNV